MPSPLALSKGRIVTVVDAATGTGTTKSLVFSIPPVGPVQTVQFGQVGATVINGNIESSMDGGTTWRTFSAFDLIANPVMTIELVAGVIYRFNISNLTTTPASVYASLR